MPVTSDTSTIAALRNLFRAPASNPYSGFIGTFMARDALSLAATHLDLTRDDTVLLPAYLCKEVLRPFAGRCRVVFYDLQDDLSVDPAEIADWLSRKRIRLLVVINYFGFLQPRRQELAILCATRQTTLLEDCAHSLLTKGSGDTGDLSVVSYRKLLPVFDGGGLGFRSPEPGFAADYHPRVYSNALSLMATAKALSGFQSGAISRAGVADLRSAESGRAGGREPGRVLPLSWFAENGAANAPFEDIIARRRTNYHFWQRLVDELPGWTPVVPELPEGACPFGFPVLIDERDSWKARLVEAGVPATVHWVLPPTVGSDCPTSRRLSERMMTLPVHPQLSPAIQARAADLLSADRRRC